MSTHEFTLHSGAASGAESYFGEMAMLSHSKRTESADVASKLYCSLYTLSRASFEMLM